MTDKLELKSSHEVIDTVNVTDVESIFYCKPTDPDILTVLMKDGKRLYCDEVCPLQEEPVSEDLENEIKKIISDESNFMKFQVRSQLIGYIAHHFAGWQKRQLMKDAKSGVGTSDSCIQFEDGTWIDLDPTMQLKPAFNVKAGEKVNVLVIKKD